MRPALTVAVIPGAGMGRRTGLRTPKAFLALGGVPLLARTIGIFQNHRKIDFIQPVLPPAHIALFRRLMAKSRWSKCLPPVAGGRERQDSVFLGIGALAPETEIVVVHDAARPFLPPTLLGRVIDEARRSGAAVAAVPVPDTVKKGSSRRLVVETVDRSSLWLAQTPQAFRADLIRLAHRRASHEGFRGTDDSSLVERIGHPVVLVPGSPLNMKITTREDLALARRLVSRR